MDRPEDARPGDRHGGARPRPGRPRLRADRQARGAGDRARTCGCGGGERRSRCGRCAHRAGLWRPRLRRGVAEEVGVALNLSPLAGRGRPSEARLPKSGAAGAQVPADAGILVVDDIVKQFDTPEGPLIAVDRVSLSVRPGEFLAVIGMVFQEESTFPWRTLIENVAFPLEIAGMSRKDRFDKAKKFVALVGLSGFENRYPAELSGGMRQRV